MSNLLADVQPITNPVITGITGKTPEAAFASLFAGLIGLLLVAATIWALIQLLIGGINWISSGGDKGLLESARNRILNAIIGLFVVFATWAIFLLLIQFFGISPIGEKGEFQLSLPKFF